MFSGVAIILDALLAGLILSLCNPLTGRRGCVVAMIAAFLVGWFLAATLLQMVDEAQIVVGIVFGLIGCALGQIIRVLIDY